MSPAKLTYMQPPARPGDSPDFSLLDIPAAGLLDVPPLDVDAQGTRDFANGLIRVLAGPTHKGIMNWRNYYITVLVGAVRSIK